VLAVLCVAAGVTVFVVARHHDTARAEPNPAPVVNTDPRARLDDPAAAQAFVSAAVTEVVTVTASDYRRLDDTLQAGLSITTGAYRAHFTAALTGAGATERRSTHSITSFEVLRSGIGTMSADGRTAKVLIVGQVHQSADDIAASDRSVLATLCLTLVKKGNRYLISNLAQDSNAGLPPGTAGLAAAAEAARSEVVDTLSYRRADFAGDLARARAGATGALLAQITSRADATRSRMTKGRYDLAGKVTAIAAQQVTDDAALFLVAATGTRVADDGATTTDADARYSVLVQRSGTTWAVGSITSIGGS